MSQSISPEWPPLAGGNTSLQRQSGFNLKNTDDNFFGQDPFFLLDEFLQSTYESPCTPVDQELGNKEKINPNGFTDHGLVVGNLNVDNYSPDSYIDPRLLGGFSCTTSDPEAHSDLGLQGNYSPGQCDLELEGPYPPLYDLDEYLGRMNQNIELENTNAKSPPTTVISVSSTPLRLSSSQAPSAQGSSPAPVTDSPSMRITRGTSKRDLATPHADASPEWDQLPTNAGQQVTKISHPVEREAPEDDLPSVGCTMAVQKIKDSGIEVPILYTIYQPLKNWGKTSQFRYTERGNLYQHVTFDEESLREFIYDHPMQQNLTLRIERHPYGFQCRYRNSPYMKCRSKKCSVGNTRSFKVGDFRIAVDEVTGRLGANQFNDNDPYFSACYFHLQCFEHLAYTPDLVMRGIIVVDDRQCHSKEPECTRGNKMGVAPATLVVFNKWREEAIKKLAEDAAWQPPEKDTLAVVIWLSSIRKGRKRARAPPGITSEDIKHKCSTHPGWGGKRVSGLSVADMVDMVQQGRSNEMIASRNGKTGKKGVKEPEMIPRRGLISETDEGNSDASPASDRSIIYHSITVAGPNSENNAPGYSTERESEASGNEAEYPPAKRSRLQSATPETPTREVFDNNIATNVPTLSISGNGDGNSRSFLNSPYDANFLQSPNFPPNNYYPQPTYYPAPAQSYGSPSTSSGFQATSSGLQETYYGHLASYCNPPKTNFNAPSTNHVFLSNPPAPLEGFGGVESSEQGIYMGPGGADNWCQWK